MHLFGFKATNSHSKDMTEPRVAKPLLNEFSALISELSAARRQYCIGPWRPISACLAETSSENLRNRHTRLSQVSNYFRRQILTSLQLQRYSEDLKWELYYKNRLRREYSLLTCISFFSIALFINITDHRDAKGPNRTFCSWIHSIMCSMVCVKLIYSSRPPKSVKWSAIWKPCRLLPYHYGHCRKFDIEQLFCTFAASPVQYIELSIYRFVNNISPLWV